MREILFHAKRKDNGEWVQGDLIHRQIWASSLCIIRESDDGFDHYEEYEVDSDTDSEFTGLHDKNGKRIFEGDIVEYENEIGLQRDIVVWTLDEYNKVAGFGLEYHVFYTITKKDQDKFEVIGNKWDNPELLGKCRT